MSATALRRFLFAALVAVSAPRAAPAKSVPPSDFARILEAQVRLARLCFSPGQVDGIWGANTQRAVRAFQSQHDLLANGELDAQTLRALREEERSPVLVRYRLSGRDLADPLVAAIPEDMMEKAELEELSYTSRAEALGEAFHASPQLLSKLNGPARLGEGRVLRVPNLGRATTSPACAAEDVGAPSPASPLAEARVVVTAADTSLHLFAGERQVFFASVTAGSEKDPLPLGDWQVTTIQRDPTFRYNPDLFWDAEPDHSQATIPPGPNNPVGRVWIDISKEHYGLHGTPEPRTVGHTASHGCIRLTNWDALYLASLIEPGTPVLFRSD